jgi:hypothetical protein
MCDKQREETVEMVCRSRSRAQMHSIDLKGWLTNKERHTYKIFNMFDVIREPLSGSRELGVESRQNLEHEVNHSLTCW